MTSLDVLDRADDVASPPVLDIVIPVHNEERALAAAVERLREHLRWLPMSSRITIADNASSDGTLAIAAELAERHPEVCVVHLPLKGRGRALKQVWSGSRSEIVAYMDVDLSTDLNALLPLVAPLASGHSDIAIGTRLDRSARVVRGLKRELISRSYNLMLRGTLRARFSDAQCGFKAMRREVADRLLPLVRDDAWFFDTELLVLAERAGLRIHEVPVDWVDDPDSRVDVVATARDDLRGIARLGWSLVRGKVPVAAVRDELGRTSRAGGRGSLRAQIAVFVLIGAASTAAYGALFLALHTVVSAQAANLVALAATAVANTAANRRLAFGVTGANGLVRHHLRGLTVFGVGLAATSGALAGVVAVAGPGHPLLEVATLTAANLVVTVLRFVAMRTWVFRQSSEEGGRSIGHTTGDAVAHAR